MLTEDIYKMTALQDLKLPTAELADDTVYVSEGTRIDSCVNDNITFRRREL